MTMIAEQNVKILKDKDLVARITTADAESYTSPSVFRSPPLQMLDPPEQLSDAARSLSNEQLRSLAEGCQPPQSWFDGDEENIF